MITPIVEARGVHKRFGTVVALEDLDLVIEDGQAVALLGPNGAGKTTFVRMLATLLGPDRGLVRVDGYDVVRDAGAVRVRIGLAGQHAAVEPTMTGRENIELVARLYGGRRRDARARATQVVDDLGLDDIADRPVRTYSGGQRRRLDLGASLVGRPRLLLLDEPTTGLDPRSRVELWEAIRHLQRQGTNVLLTTQYLDEADHLASRIVIIDHGRVIADGTPDDLKTRAGRDVIDIRLRDAAGMARAEHALQAIGATDLAVDEGARRISTPAVDGTEQLVTALRCLDAAAVPLDDIALRRPTLDEVFLALTAASDPDPELSRRPA